MARILYAARRKSTAQTRKRGPGEGFCERCGRARRAERQAWIPRPGLLYRAWHAGPAASVYLTPFPSEPPSHRACSCPHEPMIQLQNVSKSYDGGKTYAVREIDLEVAEGELLALLGTSGCGKTTTLKMLNRLVEPTAGTIRIDGRDTAGVDPVELRRSIGYVFQGIGLFPHLSIAANVAAVPRLLGWSQSDIDKRVDELLDLVGLPASKYARRMPHELSGGQRQRVGVARALAARPQVMLMDEPFGALDPVTRDSMQKELTELRKRLGITIVLVTHDMTEALLLADRIAVMSGGKIERLGTPSELLRNPGSDIVESFVQTPLNQANLIEELAGRRVEPKGEPSAEQGGAA